MTALATNNWDSTQWKSVVQRVARRTGPDEAEDLAQAAFLRLTRYSETNEVRNPAAFLVRAAVNIQIDSYRHEKHLGKFSPTLDEQPSQAPAPDVVLADRARLDRVRQGIDQLPDRTREIFLMHRFDERTYAEIAAHQSISVSAVEKHIAKAILFLTRWSKGW
jgi:RNA polymerase sigma-70 factor (ECF subfamily)